jgi:hypothetical protein
MHGGKGARPAATTTGARVSLGESPDNGNSRRGTRQKRGNVTTSGCRCGKHAGQVGWGEGSQEADLPDRRGAEGTPRQANTHNANTHKDRGPGSRAVPKKPVRFEQQLRPITAAPQTAAPHHIRKALLLAPRQLLVELLRGDVRDGLALAGGQRGELVVLVGGEGHLCLIGGGALVGVG